MNKKESERRNRQIAAHEAKAPIESKERRAKINVLWGLDLRQLPRTAKPNDFTQKLKTLKGQKFAKLLRSLKQLIEDDSLYDDISELVELVGLQDQEIEYLTPFRNELARLKTYFPEQIGNLSFKAFCTEIQPVLKEIRSREKPKQAYERKRRYQRLGGAGEIERGFGYFEQTSSQRFSNFPLASYEQLLGTYTSPVLDEIFAGKDMSTRKLPELFGLDRNRFPKKLPSFKRGREAFCDYRAVTKIMDALLSESAPSPKATKRGRPGERWLNDSAMRTRVLAGMAKRINVVSAPRHIAGAFLDVIRRHLPDSAKK